CGRGCSVPPRGIPTARWRSSAVERRSADADERSTDSMMYEPDAQLTDRLVAICRNRQASYPDVPPFHPAAAYPELRRLLSNGAVDPSNHVYGCVRESLRLLNLDVVNYGTERWNPFGRLIRPGDQVLIKPNWVCHK